MLGASVGMYNQEHFSVTCVVDVVPLELRPAVQLLVYLLELVFVGFLIAYGSRMSQLAWTQVAPTIGVSDTWAYLSVPAGATLMGTHIVGNMVQRYFPRHRSREV